MTVTASDLATPQRQSIWAIVFLVLRTIRSIGIVQILLAVGFLVARSPSITWLFVVVGLVGLVMASLAAVQWWRYTFAVISDELIVRKGLVNQQVLTLPLERIQSVSLEQKLLHRLVSLVQVSVDTAGTQTAEFTIDAVERPVATVLQRIVANYRADATRSQAAAHAVDQAVSAAPVQPPPPERTIIKHSPRRVLTIALTQLPFAGLILLGPLFAVADDIRSYIPFDLPNLDAAERGWSVLWLIPVFVMVVVFVSLLLNVLRVVITDWDLTLTSTVAGLRRNAGLLATTSVAAPVPRVQRLEVRQRLLERSAKLHTVQLHTIGMTQLAVPGCDASQAADIRELVLDGSAGVVQLPERVSGKEIFLRTRNALAFSTLAAAGLIWVTGWWALLMFLWVPMVWWATRRQVRLRRWGISDDAIADRHQFIGWARHEVLLRKVNGVHLRQSLFERKRDLASLTLATAAGSITIGMLPLAQAQQLRDRALYAVETDTGSWM